MSAYSDSLSGIACMHRYMWLAFWMPLLWGCTPLNRPELPTLMPTEHLPTAVALTLEARGANLNSPAPITSTPQNTPEVFVNPPQEPTITPTFVPTPTSPTVTPESIVLPLTTPAISIPSGVIQIQAPAEASRVTSPFRLRAQLQPGPNGVVRIELLGEDGRLLMREVKVYRPTPETPLTLGLEVRFGITAVAEAGRLVISIEDEFNRTMALASVNLILLSIGESDLNLGGETLERIVIEQPKPNALIQGGKVYVSGLARPHTDQPLVIELRTSDNRIVGIQHLVHLIPAADGEYSTFAAEVPYQVSAPTKVRLMVWERGGHIPGMAHLSSLEVMLSP
jgi:hypothetical protein